MLVNYQGQTLWIEGEKAFSVDAIKTKHKELNDKIAKIDSDLVDYINVINKTNKLRESAEVEKSNALSELEGIDYILDRIKVAEASELKIDAVTESTPAIDAPIESEEVEEVAAAGLADESTDESQGGFFFRKRR